MPIQFVGKPQNGEIWVEMEKRQFKDWPRTSLFAIIDSTFSYFIQPQAYFKECRYRYVVENGKWLDVEPAISGLPGAGQAVGTAVSAVVAASVGVAIASSKY